MTAPASTWKPGEWAARASVAGWRDTLGRARDWYSPDDFWTRRHCVYRMYDTDGHLLYVGATSALPLRMYEHKRTTPWYPQVARLVVKLAPTRRAMFEAERKAIRAEDPLHNVKHSRRELSA